MIGINRYEMAVNLINCRYASLLDVGCRDKALKKYLPGNIKYLGIDLNDKPDEEILQHNLEMGIPLGNNSFDIVLSLDVLEHLENIHFLYNELLRIAKYEVIVALPNMYHWMFRVKYCIGMDIDRTKYRIPKEKVIDRHRWLTHYYSSVEFIHANTPVEYKIDTFNFFHPYGMRRKIFYPANYVDRFIAKLFPNLSVYEMFFRITKNFKCMDY